MQTKISASGIPGLPRYLGLAPRRRYRHRFAHLDRQWRDYAIEAMLHRTALGVQSPSIMKDEFLER